MIVYGLFDPRNGELRYVGKTATSKAHRYGQHLALARRLRRGSQPVHCWIHSLLSRQLKPEIDVLEQSEDGVEAERFCIAYFRSLGCRLLNLTAGGEGIPGYRHSPDTRERLRLARRQRPPHSMETRRRMSESHRGRPCTPEVREKIAAPQRGRPKSEETRRRMSESARRKRLSPEHKLRISEGLKKHYASPL